MTRDERIRLVYARRRRFARRYAAHVLGRSPQWVERYRFERERGGFLAWEEVILLGNYLWTQRQIQAALGPNAAAVLPAMRLLVPLTIELPRYKVVALRCLARRRHVDVGEVIGGWIELGRAEAQEIDAAMAGFKIAWDFPYRQPPHYGGGESRVARERRLGRDKR